MHRISVLYPIVNELGAIFMSQIFGVIIKSDDNPLNLNTWNMHKMTWFCFAVLLLAGCSYSKRLEKYAHHYRTHNDLRSLEKLVETMKMGTDTASLRQLLGDPIDMGFDFRYLVDSVGPSGCVIGAVFHIGEQGRIDQKWVGEICE